MYACMWKCDILTSEAHNKKKKKKKIILDLSEKHI